MLSSYRSKVSTVALSRLGMHATCRVCKRFNDPMQYFESAFIPSIAIYYCILLYMLRRWWIVLLMDTWAACNLSFIFLLSFKALFYGSSLATLIIKIFLIVVAFPAFSFSKEKCKTPSPVRKHCELEDITVITTHYSWLIKIFHYGNKDINNSYFWRHKLQD